MILLLILIVFADIELRGTGVTSYAARRRLSLKITFDASPTVSDERPAIFFREGFFGLAGTSWCK
ncbi:MAG: hypothetical protein LBJ57_02060 [Prevotellaceae bacterium]|jgi:hypothetical protein|nr:hypothetical protein [Prevotellaceae bacterium]